MLGYVNGTFIDNGYSCRTAFGCFFSADNRCKRKVCLFSLKIYPDFKRNIKR